MRKRNVFFLLFSACGVGLFGQTVELVEFDTLAETATYKTVYETDSKDQSVSKIYKLETVKINPEYGYKLVALSCLDSSFLFSNGPTLMIPESCWWYEKYDSAKHFVEGFYLTGSDSVLMTDDDCIDAYYVLHPVTLFVDTIYVMRNEFLLSYAFQLWECSYLYDDKHGLERGYYAIGEVEGVCMEQNYLINYEGKWKKGRKVGKWRYYFPTGKLEKVEKYRRGELVRTKVV